MKRGVAWLKENFLLDLAPYDAVVGYRADDSYFSFARAFVNNEISLTQLSYAMRLGKLGEQFVLKSSAAFERIHFISYEIADSFLELFIGTGYAEQFALGVPKIVSGVSGTEL